MAIEIPQDWLSPKGALDLTGKILRQRDFKRLQALYESNLVSTRPGWAIRRNKDGYANRGEFLDQVSVDHLLIPHLKLIELGWDLRTTQVYLRMGDKGAGVVRMGKTLGFLTHHSWITDRGREFLSGDLTTDLEILKGFYPDGLGSEQILFRTLVARSGVTAVNGATNRVPLTTEWLAAVMQKDFKYVKSSLISQAKKDGILVEVDGKLRPLISVGDIDNGSFQPSVLTEGKRAISKLVELITFDNNDPNLVAARARLGRDRTEADRLVAIFAIVEVVANSTSPEIAQAREAFVRDAGPYLVAKNISYENLYAACIPDELKEAARNHYLGRF